MKAPAMFNLMLLLTGFILALAHKCTKECFPDSYLECPTFTDFDHCQNCCTIKPSPCTIKYNNGTEACTGEGGVCLQYCEPDSFLQCGDVIYPEHCDNCCTVAFTNCAIRKATDGSILCQGIGFDPWGRGSPAAQEI